MVEHKLVVFVHGWSVRNTDTYGEFPARLEAEMDSRGDLDIDVQHIWLGKYVSFRDEVRVEDLSQAFEAAIQRELGKELAKGRRFAAITHSTGGPVMRDWWQRFYVAQNRAGTCPMSHLIMLAPANFGSALAALGKSTVSRLKTWFQGVEPGSGVLDWLEVGSSEAWHLNVDWTKSAASWKSTPAMFPFVLTGQAIDRKLYDHVNSYTGETGSDGVVRVTGANLNSIYVRLKQEDPHAATGTRSWIAPKLVLTEHSVAPRTALAVLPGRSHSGEDMGILRSVKTSGKHPTVSAVIDCLKVTDAASYLRLCDQFDAMTAKTQADELVERQKRMLLPDSYFVHDRYTQMIVRLTDERGYALEDFDFLMTAGKKSDPDLLPQGFFIDRQRNRRHKGTVTYYLNWDVMNGCPAVREKGKLLRDESTGPKDQRLGFSVTPRPATGLMHYLPAELAAQTQTLRTFLAPNATLLLDIVLRRVVRQSVFALTRDRKPVYFDKDEPGDPIV